MKKFSTYNGLFSHNPTIIPHSLPQNNNINQNFENSLSNDRQETKNNECFDETNTQGQFMHYPQSEQNYPLPDLPTNDNKEAQSNKNVMEESENKQDNLPDYSNYTLSHNAKIILECMRMHDKIISQYEHSNK
ncbi:MAG: hypothetical protein K2L47_02930 [Clostridia bacterium]|nr:hypothetical protein [Clostridia bacterium]